MLSKCQVSAAFSEERCSIAGRLRNSHLPVFQFFWWHRDQAADFLIVLTGGYAPLRGLSERKRVPQKRHDKRSARKQLGNPREGSGNPKFWKPAVLRQSSPPCSSFFSKIADTKTLLELQNILLYDEKSQIYQIPSCSAVLFLSPTLQLLRIYEQILYFLLSYDSK